MQTVQQQPYRQTSISVQTPNKAEELRQEFIQAQYAQQQQAADKNLTSHPPTHQPKAQKTNHRTVPTTDQLQQRNKTPLKS